MSQDPARRLPTAAVTVAAIIRITGATLPSVFQIEISQNTGSPTAIFPGSTTVP